MQRRTKPTRSCAAENNRPTSLPHRIMHIPTLNQHQPGFDLVSARIVCRKASVALRSI
jgi:hypothetical protein